MTSEAHPPDDNRLDERIDAYGLGYYHGIHADGGAHSGESGTVPRRPFDWNGPRPWSGQAPAQAAAMRAAYEAG